MQRVWWVLRFRRRREQAPARRRQHRWGQWAWTLVTLAVLGVSLVTPLAAWFYAQVTADLPSPEALATWVAFPQGRIYRVTTITDRRGEPLGRWNTPSGLYLPLSAFPPKVVPVFRAVLAAADEVSDPAEAVARRLVRGWLLPEDREGRFATWRVALLARQVRQRYDDDTLLTWYLNTVPLGNEAYGLDAASRWYFGHGARELTLDEALTLAVVALAPDINPLSSPALTQERRDAWATRLVEAGVLTSEEAQQIAARPLSSPLVPSASSLPWLARLALQQAVEALHWPAPSRGLMLRTSADADLQQQAQCLAQAVIDAQATDDCEAARLLPASAFREPLSGGRAEAVVLDTATGHLLAFAGYPGKDWETYPLGMALAPWVYLTAFSRGLSPGALIWDIPATLPPGVEASNPDGVFHGPLSLRMALANGYTVPALGLVAQLGGDTVFQTARQAGLVGLPVTDGSQVYAWLLGEKGHLSLLDMAYALTPLATLGTLLGEPIGRQAQPRPPALLEAKTAAGQILLGWEKPPRRTVLSPGLAYLVTHVLRDAPARWSAFGHPNPLEIGRPVAAFVGQARQGQVVWVFGYTPQRVVAVVVAVPQGEARAAALALWHALAQYALADLPVKDWVTPPEVSTMTVCYPSGLLPTAECPTVVNEVFLSGNEPTSPDTLYRRLAVNRETGRLATVFTPPELVEERVFLQVPPEARSWAEGLGVPLAPQAYDLIVPPNPPPQARLTSPAPFAYVGQKVVLEGTATGEGFTGYGVQVGAGINPQTWVTVAQGDQPVEQGVLGSWDTSDFPAGLYTVQLVVTTQGQRVFSHTLPVVVDRTPPRLLILYPPSGEQVAYQAGEVLLVKVHVEDAYGVRVVRLLDNGRPVMQTTEPPFTLVWPLRLGEHVLTVEALDQAGNRAKAEVRVRVEK